MTWYIAIPKRLGRQHPEQNLYIKKDLAGLHNWKLTGISLLEFHDADLVQPSKLNMANAYKWLIRCRNYLVDIWLMLVMMKLLDIIKYLSRARIMIGETSPAQQHCIHYI